jgi:hypothetical protein
MRKSQPDESVLHKLKEEFTYNPETGEFRKIGVLIPSGWEVGNANKGEEGSLDIGCQILGQQYRLKCSRVAWYLHHGVWPEHQIYYKNGNNQDCRMDNLIMSEDAQIYWNATSKKRKGKTTSKYKGVCRFTSTKRYKGNGKFKAYIQFQGKHISLGVWETEEGAALAYNRKAKELFGGAARLNEIEETGDLNLQRVSK